MKPEDEKNTFTTTKSTVEVYKIRADSGFAWADVTIDANGRTGRISIASDYGNWQNYWGACGSDFKSFLAEINEGYAANKFRAEERISVKDSVQLWKELVCSYRRDAGLTAEDARAVWDDIEEMENESHSTLANAFMDTDRLSTFIFRVCGVPEFGHEPDPHFAHFWKELWPMLLAEFAKEKSLITA